MNAWPSYVFEAGTFWATCRVQGASFHLYWFAAKLSILVSWI